MSGQQFSSPHESNTDSPTSEKFAPNTIYVERLQIAWNSLQADIDRWINTVARTARQKAIRHHIKQYKQFSISAYEAFQHQIEQSNATPANEVELTKTTPSASPYWSANDLDAAEFRAIVIGMLSARWSLLRQIALQRSRNSPYLKGLAALDQLAEHYYHRVRAALPQPLQDELDEVGATFAPIIYLGHLASLAIYNQRVPLVIAVPFHAIDEPSSLSNSSSVNRFAYNADLNLSNLSRLSIPHEIGHAILVQAPSILAELQDKLPQVLKERSKASCARQRVLHAMIMNWLEEILADLIGCALGGDQVALSAMLIMGTLESRVGYTDANHPPGLIRPFIHLQVLEYLQSVRQSAPRAANIEKIRSEAASTHELRNRYSAQIVGNQLARHFKTVPTLMFLTLEEVYIELELVVDCILRYEGLRLDALRLENKEDARRLTFGELLAACDANQNPTYTNKLTRWGEIPEAENLNFALDVSGGPLPEFHVPMKDYTQPSETICNMLGRPWPCP
jgi:hypothetical protein